MTGSTEQNAPRKKLFRPGHRRRSVRTWVVALAVVLAIIIFLPRVLSLLD